MLLTALVLAAALPAAAEFRLERELALAPGGRFVLDADAGAIELRGAERSGARVVVTSPRDDIEEHFRFSFEERGDTAVVRAERRGSAVRRWFGGPGNDLRFTVEVPRRTAIDLDTAGGAITVEGVEGAAAVDTSGGSIGLAEVPGDVEAHTSGGAISAERLRGRVLLDTSGGSIRAAEIDGDLKADTSGGSIRVADVAGDARLTTSGGSIEAEGIGGFLEAHTSGGPVRASFTRGNARGGSLSSSGGGVTVSVDPAVGLEIDAATSGGRVILELPVTVQGTVSHSAVRGELNGGGPPLKLRSSGGSIRLRTL